MSLANSDLQKLRDRLEPLIPLMGITRVARLTGLDVIGLPVAQTVRPLSRSLSVSQGKGASWAAAEIGAILESAETWHAERPRLPRANARYCELVAEMKLPALESFAIRKGHAASRAERYHWVGATNIGSGPWLQTAVPLALVHTDFTTTSDIQNGPFYLSTTGLAAGDKIARVRVQAIAEIIERDAVARHFEGTGVAQQVSHDHVTDPVSLDLMSRLSKLGNAIRLKMISSVTGVPVASAILSGPVGAYRNSDAHFGGYGCSLCPQVAIQRALFEAVQSRATVIAGARDDLTPSNYHATVAAEAQSQHLYSGALAARPLSPENELAELITQLSTTGFPAILEVDLSLPDPVIHVIRVIIPGMNISVTPGDSPTPNAPQ